MVLPFVPVAVGAAALSSAIVGLQKSWDAKQNFSRADALVQEARQAAIEVAKALEIRREAVGGRLCLLARQRMEICSKSLGAFERLVNSVAASEIETIPINGGDVTIDVVPLEQVEIARYEAADFLQHGVQSAATGAMVGAGVAQAVGTWGVASTGAAISGLSGAAATNATLAWLGGGSLASGGLGVAGGTMVLNGVIAGPVLMVMGYLAAGKSEKALTEAQAHAAEMKTAVEQLTSAGMVLDTIDLRVQELVTVLEALDSRFQDTANRVSRMVGRIRREREAPYLDADTPVPAEIADGRIEYLQLGDKDRGSFELMLALGSALYRTARITIVDEQGGVTEQSATAIGEARQILEKTRGMA